MKYVAKSEEWLRSTSAGCDRRCRKTRPRSSVASLRSLHLSLLAIIPISFTFVFTAHLLSPWSARVEKHSSLSSRAAVEGRIPQRLICLFVMSYLSKAIAVASRRGGVTLSRSLAVGQTARQMPRTQLFRSLHVSAPSKPLGRIAWQPPFHTARPQAQHLALFGRTGARHMHVRALSFNAIPKAALRAARLPAYAMTAGAGALAYANYKVEGESLLRSGSCSARRGPAPVQLGDPFLPVEGFISCLGPNRNGPSFLSIDALTDVLRRRRVHRIVSRVSRQGGRSLQPSSRKRRRCIRIILRVCFRRFRICAVTMGLFDEQAG